ncbi:MAG TPA: D-tyrosyl-tRNA(Tyr) deacylase [Firmicutes bacterium]|jgi:D-tyrosyl-tRNA(Tyr) deacylase|nr:D-tyrosyl-tRNA(Tyr) deacylase [Bacillota bacterium]HAW72033.1 D-tyrosyl-tRNA(Tyr) deacylase [Bacillota bacterium]HAZ23127.1 D-tyrosyl-tRNA(Tyr) deacylase [Bacillota bacterium]HBE06741.1 D-tyrosyl-tRNA(Tyr) deacylase [Bacillota bacterium]HBG44114.1 D-tyrosyl-tRNA(Tyr) deacylase [Bacillota bacterium]
MRAVVQRVTSGAVSIDGQEVARIGRGLVVLIGVTQTDTESDASYIASKVVGLRIFEDSNGKLNLSVQEVGGAVLAISQFTLYGDARKGRRPSFTQAAAAEQAVSLYQHTVDLLKQHGISVATGVFQADMLVEINNDGPVTLLLDSERLF